MHGQPRGILDGLNPKDPNYASWGELLDPRPETAELSNEFLHPWCQLRNGTLSGGRHLDA